jgi:hypothetical protein
MGGAELPARPAPSDYPVRLTIPPPAA